MKTWDSDSPRAGRTAARKGAVTEELKKCRQDDWLGERKMDREGKERPIRSQGDQKVRRTPSGNPVSGQEKRHPGTASSDLRKNNTHREGAQRTASRSDGIQRTTPRRDSAQSAASQGDGIRRNSSRSGDAQDDGIRRSTGRSGADKSDGIRRNAARQEASQDDGIRRNASRKAGSHKKGTSGKNSRHPGGKKGKKKRTAFDAVSTVVLIAAVCVFVFSLYQLVIMLVPYYTGSKEYDEIRDLAVTTDADGEGFSVDFDVLMQENPDTIGWIRFDEPAVINYPVVKSADNEDYLTKTFTENDNKLGAIFVDYRNSSDFSDRNTFIYGHNMRVGEQMFSQLKNYRDEEYGKKYPYFYIYTPSGEVRTYTIFSAGVVDARSDNYKIEYASDEEFQEYLDLCLESSLYDFGVEVNTDSQIVSLSTCTSVTENERFLVHGVLTSVD